jgi:thioredoxin reductase
MTEQIRNSDHIVDVAIIGAGPYGLSIAAHLHARGVRIRIFGDPMSVWSAHMPRGMRLKSEGFASSLSDPGGKFPLKQYCLEQGLPYEDTGLPVPLSTFVSYGLEFQKRFVPNLEKKMVLSVQPSSVGFELKLDNGEEVLARKVVVAVGIAHYAYVPSILAGLPGNLVSHSSAHSDPDRFRGRSVAVVGAGASAVDLAALLHTAGATVHLIARRSTVRFQSPPGPRSLSNRFLQPRTGIGSGLQLYFYANMPQWFRHLPEELRLDRVRKTLGPAPPWFTKEEVVGKIAFHLGVNIIGASGVNGGVGLQLADANGTQSTVNADHVIAATGYQVDIERLNFLRPSVREKISLTDKAPALSAKFESSVPGLYFVGVSSANSFGPLMRFAFGADFTARRISRYLARAVRHQSAVYSRAENVQAIDRV